MNKHNVTHIITNMTSVQISSKNDLCPGFPVESSTLSEKRVCLCMAFECRRTHMDKDRGERGGGGRWEGESMRDTGKRKRHGEGGSMWCWCLEYRSLY